MTTQISRKDLLAKLETVAPALAQHNIVPAMSHFWFTGKEIMAYDDQIAISVPCKTDFQGAAPGKTMLELLKSSTRPNVELSATKSELQVKVGTRSSFKLGLLPPDSFVFEMPKPLNNGKGRLGKGLDTFLACLEGVMRSLGSDTSIPEQLGITVVPNGKAVELYTTNSNTISASHVQVGEVPLARRVILSTTFCKQLLALAKKAKDVRLIVAEDHALLQADDTMLFGKLIECERPYDFSGLIASHFDEQAKNNLVPLPKGFEGALARASIITDSPLARGASTFTVSENALRIVSASDRGEVKDKLTLEGEHEEISVRMEAKLLKDGLTDFNKLVLTPRVAVMTNDAGALYLVSCSKA